MVARGFLCSNIVTAAAFAGFGVSLLALQDRYDVGRGEAALAIALVSLTAGLLGPVGAWMVEHIGLRRMMLVGMTLSAVGYVLLAFAPSITIVLAVYALFIGPAVRIAGSFPALILAAGWIPHHRGRAIGFANAPVLHMLIPPIGVMIISQYSLSAFNLALALAHLAIIPFALGIKDPPAREPLTDRELVADKRVIPTRSLFADRSFWVIMIGGGLLGGIGVVDFSHMFAVMVEKGASSATAAAIVSLIALGAIIGSMLYGPICDKIGAAPSLVMLSLGFAISWTGLLLTQSIPAMACAVFLAGACAAAVYPAVNMLSVERFGMTTFPKVLGLYGVLSLPATFLMAPAAGWLHDYVGNYAWVMIAVIGCTICTAVSFATVRSHRPASSMEQLSVAG